MDGEGNLIDFHSLRHSGLTWWAENGADVQTLKQLSGHKSSRMLDRYTDHRDADAALRRLEDIDAPSPLKMTGTDGSGAANLAAPGRPLGAAAEADATGTDATLVSFSAPRTDAPRLSHSESGLTVRQTVISTLDADLPASAEEQSSHRATISAPGTDGPAGAEKETFHRATFLAPTDLCAPAAQMQSERVRSSPRHAASRYSEGRTGARVAEWTGLLNRRRGLPLPRVRIPPCPFVSLRKW